MNLLADLEARLAAEAEHRYRELVGTSWVWNRWFELYLMSAPTLDGGIAILRSQNENYLVKAVEPGEIVLVVAAERDGVVLFRSRASCFAACSWPHFQGFIRL